MAYKDKKVQKEYQRIWYQRKKKNLPTKTKLLLSPKEKEKRQKENKRRNNRKIREKRLTAKKKYCGEKCFICKYDRRLVAHRKDGRKHKSFDYMGLYEFIDELKTGKYVSLCFRCHKRIHWAMDYLNLTWDEMEKRFSTR